MASWKLALFMAIICICSVTAQQQTSTTTDQNDVVSQLLQLKSMLYDIATSLHPLKIHLHMLRVKTTLLESNTKEIILELKPKDERIKELENIIPQTLAMIASLQYNTQAIHAAEEILEEAVVSAVRKADYVLVSGISEKGFTLSKDALKSTLSIFAIALQSLKIHSYILRNTFPLLEFNIEEIILELKPKDERIKKLENIIHETLATIASLQYNIQAIHAAEEIIEETTVSASRKADDIVSSLLEKGFTNSNYALKRAKTIYDQKISLRRKLTSWVTSAFDWVVAKSSGISVQKNSKENVNEEKEGNDQVHEF